MRLTSDRVLRALARFDVATVAELAESIGRREGNRRSVWHHLQGLVAEGFASRDGERGMFARYAVTEAGRAKLELAA